MPYSFNPHTHVKIWLSLDPDSFLSKINQVRLIDMRTRNPADEIHFIYDKRLLSSAADKELHQFCVKYKIVPHDFTTDIQPKCTTDEESRLVNQYEEQFTKIAQGIYVGSLSDITRWLGPVYRLGTYSDFDTTIDTSRLGKSISVKRPLLLNLNAVPFTDKIQSVDINCDIISVVDEDAALDAIRSIQQRIVKNCSKCTPLFSPYQEYLNAARGAFELLKLPKNLSSSIDIEREAMHRLSQHKDLCTLRDVLMEWTENNAVFTRFVKENAELGGVVSTIYALTKSPYKDREMTEWRETLRHNYLINTVTYTTGAGPVVLSLFPCLLFKNLAMSKEVLPYSYTQNKLDKCFFSANQFGFSDGPHSNDLSWLKSSETVILERRREEQIVREKASVTALPSGGLFATPSSLPVSPPKMLLPEVIEAVTLYNREIHKTLLKTWLSSQNKYAVDAHGRSLLHYAAATGKVDLVRFFIDRKGFSIELEDSNGDTASSYADKQSAINSELTTEQKNKINECIDTLSQKKSKGYFFAPCVFIIKTTH